MSVSRRASEQAPFTRHKMGRVYWDTRSRVRTRGPADGKIVPVYVALVRTAAGQTPPAADSHLPSKGAARRRTLGCRAMRRDVCGPRTQQCGREPPRTTGRRLLPDETRQPGGRAGGSRARPAGVVQLQGRFRNTARGSRTSANGSPNSSRSR
jgi:hypothetical protein